MGVLSGLEPQSVFSYFEEITRIPHGSGDTKRISDYLAGFAGDRGLRYHQDESDNIIIWADASPGYEHLPSVMLQGHMDMVCEKTADSDTDFKSDGLSLIVEDGSITAAGTTLGGDDGVAVAYMLAILSDETIAHPPLECVFTSDEEIGMLGAAALDMSLLSSKIMINLDSDAEGYLLTSCAGGATAEVRLPVSREPAPGMDGFKLSVGGLAGGHSGSDIDRNRASAVFVLGRLLARISDTCGIRLHSISCPGKENAIPRHAWAFITVNDTVGTGEAVRELAGCIKSEYSQTDPGIEIELSPAEVQGDPMDEASTGGAISMLRLFPQGIVRMNPDLKDMVQTSVNIGIVSTEEDLITATMCTRSSRPSELDELHDRIGRIADLIGGTLEISGVYPGMEYREDSPLRELMQKVYRDMYGRDITVCSIHAGVECGLFSGGIKDLDVVSIGPDITDIHTPDEALSIESMRRTWEYLIKVLESFDQI